MDQLGLYNKALLVCADRFLSALTDSSEPRRLLDHVWDTGGVRFCLEQAAWWFAMRVSRIEVDDAFTSPDFGYQNAFTKPTDWVTTVAVAQDEFFRMPLRDYEDEAGYFFADIEPIYVRFVSDDALYGADLSRWPSSFSDYVANYFASKIIGKLAGDKSRQIIDLLGPPGAPEKGALTHSLRTAKAASARTQPTRFPAEGSWTRARRGAGRNRGPLGDGGSGGQLIG